MPSPRSGYFKWQQDVVNDRQIAQAILDEVVKEYSQKIADLAQLTADLPTRLLIGVSPRIHGAVHSSDNTMSAYSASVDTDDLRQDVRGSSLLAMPSKIWPLQKPPEINALRDSNVPVTETSWSNYSPVASSSQAVQSQECPTPTKKETRRSILTPSGQKSRSSVTIDGEDDGEDEEAEYRSKKHVNMRRSVEFDDGSFGDEKKVSRTEARQTRVRPSEIPAHMRKFGSTISAISHTVAEHANEDDIPVSQEFAFGLLIFVNALFMGIDLQYRAETGEDPEWAEITNLVFCVIFVLEIGFRMYQLRMQFFFGVEWGWNAFDSTVVICMVIEEVVQRTTESKGVGSVALFRSLRLLRVVRVLRAIKLIYYLTIVRQGRLLVLSILGAYRIVLWVLLLLAGLVYMIALVMTSGALDHCRGRATIDPLLCDRFGTLWRSASSSYQALLGGVRWGVLLDALAPIELHYSAIFVAFITFITTAILQVITGIFVWAVHDVAEKEKRNAFIHDHLRERNKFVQKMSHLFLELDINENGALSKDELEMAFRDDAIRATFVELDLDTTAVENIFELLDMDLSGHVSIEEFALGCLRLRGKARAVDLQLARRDLVAIRASLTDVKQMLVQINQRQFLKDKKAHAEKMSGRMSIPGYMKKTRSSTAGMLLTCASTLRSGSNLDNSWNRIEKAEMRAMTLREMQDVMNVIKGTCTSESWKDAESGEQLHPKKVNLYHFNYHYISPHTCMANITLIGLEKREYKAGQMLKQSNSKGTVLGLAEITEDADATEVEVRLLKGQFFPKGSFHTSPVVLEDGGEEHDCGIPEMVLNDNSISYKELISSTPTKPQWFVCHWWGEPVSDFVTCCAGHCEKRKMDKTSAYWVCAYANRQHELGTDIGSDPEESSFRKGMNYAEGLLLLLDKDAVPFQRIWCDFELFKTVTSEDKMLDIVTVSRNEPRLLTQRPIPGEHAIHKFLREREFPVVLLTKGIQVNLESGSATVAEDKAHILHSMGTNPTNGVFTETLQQEMIDYANRTLRGYFAVSAWPQAVKRGRVRNFDGKSSAQEGELVSLPEILRQDSGRNSLEMVFAGILEVTDTEVRSIADGLPPNLSSLVLSFEACANITDAGLKTLAEGMESLSLHTLHLDLMGCAQLTDASVVVLASKLPSSLVDVRLDFALCPELSKDSVKALAANLPTTLTKLKATFRGTKFDHSFDSITQLKKVTGTKLWT